MQFGQMVCATSRNIGDDIQSVAAARLLPRVDLFVDREGMAEFSNAEPVCVVMNAWFMQSKSWPPSASIAPIFVGFHVTRERRSLVAGHAGYLKRFEPIGTRDEGTAEFLRSLGIKAEATYCLTMSLPRREREPPDGRVVIVDADKIAIPKSIYRGSARFSHGVAHVRGETKLQYARDLLDLYRDTARLVITTRLHCALPCIAMGIPVVFFGDPADYRTKVVRDIGGTIYDYRLHSKSPWKGRGTVGRVWQPVDWTPKPLDITAHRQRLIDRVSAQIATLQSRQAA